MGHQHSTTELLPVGDSGRTDVIANVVFVHGLGGHNRATWQSDERDDTTFWPQWLYDDLRASSGNGAAVSPPVGVWSLGYPAELFRVLFFSKRREDSVPERAKNLTNTLVTHGLADRPIIFVTHSLGGILVKQMLRTSRDAGNPRTSEFARLAQSTRLVMFLATPHTGSSMARAAVAVPMAFGLLASAFSSTIDWLPLWGFARVLARRAIRPGHFTKALESGDPYLEDLRDWYCNNAPECGFATQAYYENLPTKRIGVVVDKESANPGVSGVNVIGLDADHTSICKPASRNEHYRSVLHPIRRTIEKLPLFKETHLAALDVGERFEKLATLLPADRMRATKKVVQPIEKRLGRTTPMSYETSVCGDAPFVVANWQAAAASSGYDLDRVIMYVWHEYMGGIPESDPTQNVRHEVELLKATGLDDRGKLSLPPLYYAARALKKQRQHVVISEDGMSDLLAALELVETLAMKFKMDDTEDTRKVLRALAHPA